MLKLLTHFKPGLIPSLVVLCLFALFIKLGIWQGHRYHEKKALLSQYAKALRAMPMDFNATKKYQAFQHMRVSGTYINNQTILLTDRLKEGKPGFEIITPFKINQQTPLLLVNRGWLPADRNPLILPSIPLAVGTKTIMGYIFFPDKKGFFVGKNLLNSGKSPILIQKIDFSLISKATHQVYYPFLLRLDVNQPDGFDRHWLLVNLTPERHLGYMVQWYAMAIALFIAFICFAYRRGHD